MILATMSFRGYNWEYNPTKLEITNSFLRHQYTVPSGKTSVESLQKNPVVYKGEGEFFGIDCLEKYAQLEKLFTEGRKGVLSLPDMPSVYAWFTGLSLVGDTTENLLKYRFEFVQASTSQGFGQRRFHICKEGETLYDIAFDYGVQIERLVECNPRIRRPDELKDGEQVRLC